MYWPAFILADLVKLVVGNNWCGDCASFILTCSVQKLWYRGTEAHSIMHYTLLTTMPYSMDSPLEI